MSDGVDESTGKTGKKPPNDRLIGLGILGVGCLILLWFVGWPVYQAHGEVTEIKIYKKFIAFGLMAVVAGINGIVFGEAAFSWFPSGDTNLSDIKLVTWLIIVANIPVLGYMFMLLEGYLKSLGYDTSQF